MCTLINKYREKRTFTGYKIALKINGKYYSPATGIEYKPGLVTIPTETKKETALTSFFSSNILKNVTGPYNKLMKGRTAVFINIKPADILYYMCKTELSIFKNKNHIHQYNLHEKIVILEMTISKEMMRGKYMYDSVIAGKRIKSFKEIK